MLYIGLETDYSFSCKICEKETLYNLGCWFDFEIIENINVTNLEFDSLNRFSKIKSFSNATLFIKALDHFTNTEFLELVWLYFNNLSWYILNKEDRHERWKKLFSSNPSNLKLQTFFNSLIAKLEVEKGVLTSEMIEKTENKTLKRKLGKDNNREKEKKLSHQPVLFDSAFDMFNLIIGTYLYFCDKTPICFNLPAGAGKTFYMDKLALVFENDLLIACPTAKACTHYTNFHARTIHSTFHINPRTLQIEFNRVFISTINLIIFDEFSVISSKLLDKLMPLIKDKNIYLLGDMAQLPPVAGKICLNDSFAIFDASKNFFLPRFLNKEFATFVLDVRNKILKNSDPIDKDNFKNIINILRKNSKNINIDTFIDECNTNYRLSLEEISKGGNNFPHFFPLITSVNATCRLIQSKMDFRYKNNEIMRNCIFLHKDQTMKQYESGILDLPSNVGNEDNKICLASLVMFKKNISDTSVVNGRCAILTEIDIPDDFVEYETRLVRKTDSKPGKRVVVYSGTLPRLTFYWKNKKINYKAQKLKCCYEKCNESCKIHATIDVFYIEPAYSITLHCLQGSTISENDVVQVSSDVTRFNQLRAFYVLISRFRNIADIVLSPEVIDKFEKNFKL